MAQPRAKKYKKFSKHQREKVGRRIDEIFEENKGELRGVNGLAFRLAGRINRYPLGLSWEEVGELIQLILDDKVKSGELEVRGENLFRTNATAIPEPNRQPKLRKGRRTRAMPLFQPERISASP